MNMIEREKTFLAKYLPDGLGTCRQLELLDVYLPISSKHPKLRIRKRGDKLEITKKTLLNPDDASTQVEQTIALSVDEFDELSKINGKRIRKIRYYYDYNGRCVEFDVFQDDLKGLVLVDVEFETSEEQHKFTIPNFCLTEVTQEDFLAGGMLCGKKYTDIINDLNRLNYRAIVS
jgi:CYTH domain-containing protein